MRKNFIALGASFLLLGAAFAQTTGGLTNAPGSEYQFTLVHNIEAASPVQDQYKTGTCWSFSSLGFFESELERMGKGKHNLSEMWVVNLAYKDKARRYVRMHGKTNFGPGGAFHDTPYVWENYGIVPEEAYRGLDYGTDKHDHGELNRLLESYTGAVLNGDKGNPAPNWAAGFDAITDAYLGAPPQQFTYNGKQYTPQSFAEWLDIDFGDYAAITSFTHHPFYEEFVLEVPDNWLSETMYNVPLDEMMAIIDNALEQGITVAWAADVSEKGFNYKQGIALVPENDEAIQQKGSDSKYFNDAGADRVGNAFLVPLPEKKVTQEMRQQQFDNWQTTDDHGMQITGLVKDQSGKKFYIVKNSWGVTNSCDGYLYVSEQYIRLKTTNILVHKDALPKETLKKWEGV